MTDSQHQNIIIIPIKTTTITRKVNFITKHWDGGDRQTNHMPAAGLPANENNRQSVVEKWSQETVFWLFYKQRETNTARKGKYKRKTQINTNKCTQTYLYIKIYVYVCDGYLYRFVYDIRMPQGKNFT